MFEVKSGRQVWKRNISARYFSLHTALFTRDGQTIITDDGELIDAKTGRMQGTLEDYDCGRLAFSLDGKTLVSVSEKQVTLWVVETAQRRAIPGKSNVSPDGKKVTTDVGDVIDLCSPLYAWNLGDETPELADPDGEVRVQLHTEPPAKRDEREWKGRKEEMEWKGKEEKMAWPRTEKKDPRTVAPSPRKVVVSVRGGRDAGAVGTYLNVVGVAFSPDGKYLALGFEDRRVLLWDISPAK